jgi:nucleotide-binding universal stress UspA family protein
VAWKDTREARLAVAAALPILALAKHVTIVEIAEECEQASALGRTQDVAKWLALHGITAEALAVPSRGDDADALNALLTDHQCDLVVAGAYGHDRMREWVFGGVTDNLLHGHRCALLAH